MINPNKINSDTLKANIKNLADFIQDLDAPYLHSIQPLRPETTEYINKLKSNVSHDQLFENDEAAQTHLNYIISDLADDKTIGKDNTTPLMWAAYYGHNEIVKLLLNANVNVYLKNKWGDTAHLYAVNHGHLEIVKQLLNANANVDLSNDLWGKTLIIAVCQGRLEIVKLLLNAKVNINATMGDGYTALMEASRYGHRDIVELLLNAGAYVSATTKGGNTAHDIAIVNGHKEIADLISIKQFYDAAKNLNGNKLETLLREYQQDNITQEKMLNHIFKLAEAAPNMDEKISILEKAIETDNTTKIPLNALSAFMHKQWAVTRFFHGSESAIVLEIKRKINALKLGKSKESNKIIDNLGQELKENIQAFVDFHQSVSKNTTNFLEKLTFETQKIARLTASISDTTTFRFKDAEAAQKCLDEVIEVLANDNVRDIKGNTALMCASRDGNRTMVALLLKAHVNVNAQRDSGCTAISIAAANGHLEIVKLLLEAKYNVNVHAKNNVGNNALMIAAKYGHLEILELLLEHKAMVNDTSVENSTALMVAAARGHLNIVKRLLDVDGIEMHAKSRKYTAYNHAVRNEHKEIADLIMAKECSDFYNASCKGADLQTLLNKNPDITPIEIYKFLFKLVNAEPDMYRKISILQDAIDTNINGKPRHALSEYLRHDTGIISYLSGRAHLVNGIKAKIVELQSEPELTRVTANNPRIN